MNVIFFRAHTDTDILVAYTRRTAVIDFLMIRLRVVARLVKKNLIWQKVLIAENAVLHKG